MCVRVCVVRGMVRCKCVRVRAMWRGSCVCVRALWVVGARVHMVCVRVSVRVVCRVCVLVLRAPVV